MDKIIITSNPKPILKVMKFLQRKGNEEFVCECINIWRSMKDKKIYLIKNEKNEISAFAILHKMDFDPLNIFKNPYLLDLIYVFEQYRRKGYALKILEKLKDNREELTMFCSNDSSINLFKKAGYDYVGIRNNSDFFRSPM